VAALEAELADLSYSNLMRKMAERHRQREEEEEKRQR